MKKWYQYRCEEVQIREPNGIFLTLNKLRLAKRLDLFLFRKALEGGIRWTFSVGWSDWRAIYGTSAEE